jgi:cob(I)alamin adenosyltransferase
VAELEAAIDRYDEPLPPLREFILPGGSRLAAELHLARTVCRRAERLAVTLSATSPVEPNALRYLNRLSDLLFVLARSANAAAGVADVTWKKV